MFTCTTETFVADEGIQVGRAIKIFYHTLFQIGTGLVIVIVTEYFLTRLTT